MLALSNLHSTLHGGNCTGKKSECLTADSPPPPPRAARKAAALPTHLAADKNSSGFAFNPILRFRYLGLVGSLRHAMRNPTSLTILRRCNRVHETPCLAAQPAIIQMLQNQVCNHPTPEADTSKLQPYNTFKDIYGQHDEQDRNDGLQCKVKMKTENSSPRHRARCSQRPISKAF